MKRLIVRNLYNGNFMMVPNKEPEDYWFKLTIIILIIFLIIKILIINL